MGATNASFQAGFVLEQTLGHVTHSMNLKRFLGGSDCLDPRWFDIPFRPESLRYKVPPASLNWSLRGSLFARDLLAGPQAKGLDALFVHTLTVGLLAGASYERIPTVISVDATPINLDGVAAAYGHKRMPAAVEKFKQQMVRRALEPARAYVAWCGWAKDSLVEDYGVSPEKVHVIAPGADIDLFEGQKRCEQSGLVRILF